MLDDPAVEAVYVPLPNALHAEWTIAALEAGKAVFCEKPLCGTVEETERVLAVARQTGRPLWEAFVFPFHDQIATVRALLADGAIGDVREVSSRFHFLLDDPRDVRMLAELAGGSIQDVGCYPIRLARLLFEDEPERDGAIADAVPLDDGVVDVELWGALRFPAGRRLVLSCGFRLEGDTETRILGTEGELRLTNPFHPGPDDAFSLVREDREERHPAMPTGERSFTPAIRHVQRAIRGEEPPRHLAVDDALGNARAIDALRRAAGLAGVPVA